MGWTPELVNSYVEQRNQATTKRILGLFDGNINPRTGKPRRREKFEGAAYGWHPQNFWRRNRGVE
jgi:hypothetical protein